MIGIPDDYRGEAAKAFVKLRAAPSRSRWTNCATFLTGKLGKHELPAALEFVDELPRTPVGKLSRHELRDSSRRRSRSSHRRPATSDAARSRPYPCARIAQVDGSLTTVRWRAGLPG